MKILAIRGKNLASLEGEFEIDFTSEPLRSAGIFAITGQTGAGKSTILDALCLALFDNAPRLNKAEASVNVYDIEDKTITLKDSRNILRKGTSDGYAEVDFIALNGDHYRSRWMVRRARGKVDGALQATSIKLENIITKTEEQGTKSNLLNRIVELIGLNFDQFTRAVLLAQGDFATFLKAKSSEKAELLEKLTGTEVYSRISEAIYRKTIEANNALLLVQQQIEGVKLLSEEELEALINERNTKNEELKPLKFEASQIEKKLAWIRQDEQLKLDIEQAEKEFNTIRSKKEMASPRYDYMNMIEKSLEIRDQYIEFINKSSSLEKISLEIDQNNMSLKTLTDQSETIENALSKALNIQKETNNQYNTIKPDIDRARELDIKIQSAIEKLTEIKKELEQYKSQLTVSEQTINSLNKSLDKSRHDKSTLTTWFLQHKDYSTIVSKTDLIDNLIRTAYSVEKQKESTLKSLGISQSLASSLTMQLNEYEVEAERLNNLLPSEIINLRQRLVEGEACPVCGSIHHPFKIGIKQTQRINEEELENTKKHVQENINKIKQQLEQNQKRTTEFETYIKNFNEQYTDIFNSLEEYLSLVPDWKSKYEKGTLSETLLTISSLWKKNEKELENCTLLLENSSARIDVENKAQAIILENITSKDKTLQSGIDIYRKDIAQRKQLLNGKSVEEVEAYYIRLKESQSHEVETLKKTKENIDIQKSTLQGKINQLRKDVQLNKDSQSQLSAVIRKWLQNKDNPIDEEILKDLIAKSREWISRENQELTEIENQFLTGKTTLKERESKKMKHSESEDKPLDLETKEVLTDRFTSISELTENISKCLSEIEVRLLAHEQGKEHIKAFEKELTNKSELYENWAKLNDLLGSANGNKFKTIAQGYTLDILLGYANKHLQELSQRYSLEKIPDTLALQVIDNDMLGEVRSVHSLSGGESFLISLALALGLSSLSSNKMKIESLFIDEGFGALDIDTLSIAMDALDNLQTQGRKIGVISHVEEMKERITTQIQVLKSANGKSTIRVIG